MGKEDRQRSYSEEQGDALVTYSAGVTFDGSPQESMITVGIVRGGVIFPAVEAIYSSNGRLDAYVAHIGGEQLEWKKPRENALRDIDNKFVVKNILPFESISFPVQVAGLPTILDKGKVTREDLAGYVVDITPRMPQQEGALRSIDAKVRKPQEPLAATGDQ